MTPAQVPTWVATHWVITIQDEHLDGGCWEEHKMKGETAALVLNEMPERHAKRDD